MIGVWERCLLYMCLFPGFQISDWFVPLENHDYVDFVKLHLKGSCIRSSSSLPFSALCVHRIDL